MQHIPDHNSPTRNSQRGDSKWEISAGSQNSSVMRENVEMTPTDPVLEDLLKRVYEVCVDGYKVLLAGVLDTDEIRSRLDSEYVRLQLWGIDTGILKGKLSILHSHPLYKTAGFILLKIMRRLVRLGVAYLTVDDAAKATWLKRTSEYILEVPSFFHAPYDREKNNKIPAEDKDRTLTVEQKVQRLHDAFWAERREQGEPRIQTSVHSGTVGDEQEPHKQEQVGVDWGGGINLATGSEHPSIDPSDSASQTGTDSKLAEQASPSEDKPNSTVSSSQNGSSTSSESSIVVLKVIEALAAFNNCLFSIIKEMDMAMADYGEGSLSQLYTAVKVKAGETTAAQKTPSVTVEISTHHGESPTKVTPGTDKRAMEMAPTRVLDITNASAVDEEKTTVAPIETTKKVNFVSFASSVQAHSALHSPSRSALNSPIVSQWQPVYIPLPPHLPPGHPSSQPQEEHISPYPDPPSSLSSPPPPRDPKIPPSAPPEFQVKPENQQALVAKIPGQKPQNAPLRQPSTQDHNVAQKLSPAQSSAPIMEDSTFQNLNREEIVAAAMTNDKSLFDLMQTYPDVGFGLFCERHEEIVVEAAKQPWLSLDLAMCMWKNTSDVIRNKFKELAKNKIRDLKKLDDEITQARNTFRGTQLKPLRPRYSGLGNDGREHYSKSESGSHWMSNYSDSSGPASKWSENIYYGHGRHHSATSSDSESSDEDDYRSRSRRSNRSRGRNWGSRNHHAGRYRPPLYQEPWHDTPLFPKSAGQAPWLEPSMSSVSEPVPPIPHHIHPNLAGTPLTQYPTYPGAHPPISPKHPSLYPQNTSRGEAALFRHSPGSAQDPQASGVGLQHRNMNHQKDNQAIIEYKKYLAQLEEDWNQSTNGPSPQSHARVPGSSPAVQTTSQAQTSSSPRDPPRSILRTGTGMPSSNAAIQVSVSGESDPDTGGSKNDLEQRLTSLEHLVHRMGPLSIPPPPQLPSGYTTNYPPPSAPARARQSIYDHPAPPLRAVTPARRSVTIAEDAAV